MAPAGRSGISSGNRSKRTKASEISISRARLAIIEKSTDVVIDGITFKDSQFWNLHLYRCQDVLVQNAKFEVPDNYKQAPSTDGIDVDSSQDITIKDCYFSVTDDCIAMKGAKGPDADRNKDSPPTERVRISGCTFRRGHAAVNFGSEAHLVRDIVAENCRVTGDMTIANFKLRLDTPQTYEDIHYRDFTLEGGGSRAILVRISPWTQYTDLKGQQPPKSTVRNITLTKIRGEFGVFGEIRGNPGQTTISDITLKDIDMMLTKNAKLKVDGEVQNLVIEDVKVNGKRYSH